MTRCEVILVDDEEDIRLSVQQSLELKGFDVTAFARADRALDRLGRDFPGVLVSDIRMPRMDGIQLLDAVMEIDPDQPVILVTGNGDVPMAVAALAKGAYDFIEKPFSTDRLAQSIARAAERRRMALELRVLRAAPTPDDPLEAMLHGRSPAMIELRGRIRTVAATDLDVLIVGETGTGKELVARALHQLSDRAAKPFVTVNLAALPADHAEAELFGHVAGAFHGALRARTGRLEHARGGTVYLDEIGSAPLGLQVKLLRVLEDRAIEPLGASDRVQLDVRFVASTREGLETLVAQGRFRDDLLYRVNPVTLHLPPLRARPGDAPRLFQVFATEAARRYGRPPPEIPPDRLLAIAAQDWPGNLRELKNAADRHVLGIETDTAPAGEAGLGLVERVNRFERDVIIATLAANEGSLKATYESLGLARKTLYEKMQKHGLRREDFGD
ncbi:sigma-54 dependent transcriptional regulator [Tropicimonas sp. IMCC34043]|uniref:sigma-54-dependent transcriptional regulator n=1 Tax=Tropicimonas sp. IMCC34043 TaxID=2248760 RepID=UPI000E272F82|nr:sigma-54 dependent transcriptional regulator [Tropicimonas sp. IMCC34043]